METLGTFGSRIDAWVIAEGIERAGELQRLMQLEVPLGQGYRLGPPRARRCAPLQPEVLELHQRIERGTGDGVGQLVEAAVVVDAGPTDVGGSSAPTPSSTSSSWSTPTRARRRCTSVPASSAACATAARRCGAGRRAGPTTWRDAR